MRRTSQFAAAILVAWFVASGLLDAATTALNFAEQLAGVGLVANGFTGAATTNASTVLSGPTSGAAAAYSFKTYPFSQFNAVPSLALQTQVQCAATGSSFTGIGDACTNFSSLADALASSTEPSRGTIISDTTGAGCTAIITGTAQFYVGRDLTVTWYAAQKTVGSGWFSAGFATGAASFCNNDDPNTANHIRLIYSQGVDSFWSLYTAAAGGAGQSQKTASAVAPDTSYHWYRIQYSSATGNVTAYIDDFATPIVTNTSFIPSTAVMYFGFWEYCKGGAAAPCNGTAQEVDVARFQITTTPF